MAQCWFQLLASERRRILIKMKTIRLDAMFNQPDQPDVEADAFPDRDHQPFVVDEFRKKSEVFLERNKLYGGNYKRFGKAFGALFPNGTMLNANDEKQMNRLHLFIVITQKLTRYAENFHRGGHDDSLDDIAVYSMMLKELDHEQ